jgi:hypothetical protein
MMPTAVGWLSLLNPESDVSIQDVSVQIAITGLILLYVSGKTIWDIINSITS